MYQACFFSVRRQRWIKQSTPEAEPRGPMNRFAPARDAYHTAVRSMSSCLLIARSLRHCSVLNCYRHDNDVTGSFPKLQERQPVLFFATPTKKNQRGDLVSTLLHTSCMERTGPQGPGGKRGVRAEHPQGPHPGGADDGGGEGGDGGNRDIEEGRKEQVLIG